MHVWSGMNLQVLFNTAISSIRVAFNNWCEDPALCNATKASNSNVDNTINDIVTNRDILNQDGATTAWHPLQLMLSSECAVQVGEVASPCC